MWNQILYNLVSSINLKQSVNDACVYYYFKYPIFIIVSVFVDHILVITITKCFLDNLYLNLNKSFPTKNLGQVTKFLGINMSVDPFKGLTKFNQMDYMKQILKKFGLDSCKSVGTPLPSGLNLKELYGTHQNSSDKDLS